MNISTAKSKIITAKGFTLIELILYTASISLFIFAVSGLYFLILQARVKSQVIAEVEQQGLQVIQIMTQTIRNGTSINNPAQNQTSTSLSVNVTDSGESPTLFDISGGAVRISEGINGPVNLTSSRISATSLSIKNLSRADTPNTVRIQLTLDYINPSGRSEYNYTKTFYGSASVRI